MSILTKIKRFFQKQPVRESPASVVIEHMEYTKGGAFELSASHPNFVNLINEIVKFFKDKGGVNYVELNIFNEETGPLVITIQRREGETPATQANKWKVMYNEVIKLLSAKEIKHDADLALFLKAARIQRDMLKTGFWSHAVVCNYPRADGSTDDKGHCNCGVADMLKALRVYEEDHSKGNPT